MEAITKIPGLQHISKDIFKLLDIKNLFDCRRVNSSWNMDHQPIFWLKKLKFENPQVNVQKSWEILAQELTKKDEKLTKKFILILNKIIISEKRKTIISLNGKLLERNQPYQIVSELMRSNKYTDLVKFILKHENPMSKLKRVNSTGNYLYNTFTILEDATPIHMASLYGFTEVVKKLTKMMDTPIIEVSIIYFFDDRSTSRHKQ